MIDVQVPCVFCTSQTSEVNQNWNVALQCNGRYEEVESSHQAAKCSGLIMVVVSVHRIDNEACRTYLESVFDKFAVKRLIR